MKTTDVRVKFCLPGMCLTVWVPPDADPYYAAELVARKYAVGTGDELDNFQIQTLADKIKKEQDEASHR